MSSPVLIEQLDSAIDVLLHHPDAAIPNADSTMAEFLGIAAELRALPRPGFRAGLKQELTQRSAAALIAEQPELQVLDAVAGKIALAARVPRREEQILPTLFGHGYGTYAVRRSNFAVSLAAHAAVLGLLLASGFMLSNKKVREEAVQLVATSSISDYLPMIPHSKSAQGGGGGGDRDLVHAPQGRLPRTAMQQITPPEVVIRNDHPALPAEATVVAPPQIKMSSNLPNLGDPRSSVAGPPSNGYGYGSGIGEGRGGGIGSGAGGGVGPGIGGGIGGGVFRVGGGVSAPRPIYKPDPEYSTEARQAKYQGTVTLSIIVGADGRARDIKVARSLGMGLDEKAVEAVRQWRFDPATKDGKPVAVLVNVEVAFRLF